jgi:hypothetical protein
MKKALFACNLLLFLTAPLYAQFDLNSISGHIGYRQEYQDQRIGDQFTTQLMHTPDLFLLFDGDVLDPQILNFFLQTDITNNATSMQFGSGSTNFSELTWDYYRADVRFFDTAPLRAEFRADDGLVNSHTQYGTVDALTGESRMQNQEVTLMANGLSELPPLTFDYSRSLNWAVIGTPSDVLNQTYSLSAAASNGSTSYNFHADENETDDLINNTSLKIFDVRLNGVKAFSNLQQLNLETDYNRYDQLDIFNGTASYFGTLSERVNMNSSLNLVETSSPGAVGTEISGGNTVNYNPNAAMRYTLGITGLLNNASIEESGASSASTSDNLSITSTAQHNGSWASGSVANSLSITAGVQNDVFGYRTIGGGLSNGYQVSRGRFDIGLNQGFTSSFTSRSDGEDYYTVSTLASGFVSGMVSDRIQERSSLSYTDNRATGVLNSPGMSRVIQASQSMSGSFYYKIHFTLDAGVTVNWFLSGVTGTTNAWNLGFTSGDFFVSGLSFRYNYARDYDLFYRLETLDQSAEFHYQWRMLRFGLRLEQADFVTDRRDVTFTVVRDF